MELNYISPLVLNLHFSIRVSLNSFILFTLNISNYKFRFFLLLRQSYMNDDLNQNVIKVRVMLRDIKKN